VPALHGFEPTVRLYAGDYPWCSLNAASERHRQAFVGLMDL